MPPGRSRAGTAVRFTLVLAFAPAVPILLSAAAHATPPVPGTWSGNFSIPAFDGPTTSCAILEGRYYVAGDFRWSGDVPVRNVAMWTGSDWAQVGEGLPERVNCLAVRNGRLIAGIQSAAYTSAVMEFDGLSWQSLGPQLYGRVDALIVSGAEVYAAGQIYLVGLANGDHVVRWSGGAWEPVGGMFDGRIRSLATYRGELHAGGEFLHADETFASRIARWDGSRWHDVGGGTGAGGQVYVAALEVFQDRLIAGGWFDSVGGVAVNNVAAWDGSSWAPLPATPSDAIVSGLAVEGSVLHAAGVFQVPGSWASGLVTFDGSQWTPPDWYPSWGVVDVAVANGLLLAVGRFADLSHGVPAVDFKPARDVLVRDGSWHDLVAWKPAMRGLLGPGFTSVQSVANYGGELFAGGYFYHAAEPPSWKITGGLARFDGSRWHVVGEPVHGYVWEMATVGHRLVVGGPGMGVAGLNSAVLAWDGKSWSDLGGSLYGTVTGLAEWQGAVVAVGGFMSRGNDRFEVAINRGSGWEPLGPAFSGEPWPRDVAVFRGDLYVAGERLALPGTGPSGLARWDGSGWSEVPGTPLPAVSCVQPIGNELWIGASASSAGAAWRWNGSSWTSVGSLSGYLTRLLEADGEIFACGALYTAGTQTTMARWDGRAWQPIDEAPESRVEAMAIVGGDLYVGGWFTRAGGRQAEAIARWSGFAILPRPGLVHFAAPRPSPARDRVSFRFGLRFGGPVRLLLYDLRGAVVARPVDESLPAGSYERTWSVPRSVRPGVYFARLTGPDGPAVAKVVIAP